MINQSVSISFEFDLVDDDDDEGVVFDDNDEEGVCNFFSIIA
jgi:hypothetical protein